ncbi:chitin-binding type-2 domain-containing protein [Nephila pilipes]|uniref:Chitin-binding type-2 domain-containing protein n=1 Tax=Nephila pilipes TaxID=299642 RepID=A0A8X6PAJ8_NEPPI|nr:chitin-binding type-2 domain-containing protein [Nephila pilipes]
MKIAGEKMETYTDSGNHEKLDSVSTPEFFERYEPQDFFEKYLTHPHDHVTSHDPEEPVEPEPVHVDDFETTPDVSDSDSVPISFPSVTDYEESLSSFHPCNDFLEYSDSVISEPLKGIPGVDFPDYEDIPLTSFDCAHKEYHPGFYADMETGCQVFHVCYDNRKASFLCPIGTIFNQAILTCDFWYNSNCSTTPQHYYKNIDVGYVPQEDEETDEFYDDDDDIFDNWFLYGHPFPESRHPTPRSKHPTPKSWYPTVGPRPSTPGPKHTTHEPWHPTPEPKQTTREPWHPTPETRYPTPGSRHTTPRSRYPWPGSRHPTPGSRHPQPGSKRPSPGTTNAHESLLSPLEYLKLFFKFFPIRAKVSVYPVNGKTKVEAVTSIGEAKQHVSVLSESGNATVFAEASVDGKKHRPSKAGYASTTELRNSETERTSKNIDPSVHNDIDEAFAIVRRVLENVGRLVSNNSYAEGNANNNGQVTSSSSYRRRPYCTCKNVPYSNNPRHGYHRRCSCRLNPRFIVRSATF